MTAHDAVRRVRLAELAVPPLALATPLVSFLRFHEYPLLRTEVALALCATVAAGLALDVLIAVRPKVLRPAFFALLVFVAADLQYHFVQKLQLSFEPASVGMLIAVAILFALGVLTWLIRDGAGTILCTAFGVILVSVLVLPTDTVESGVRFDRPTASRSDLPPVVHIVLDEHIGLDGVPADIEGGKQLRAFIADFYSRNGFALYDRTFSAFAETHYSLASLLNGVIDPPAPNVLRQTGVRFQLLENDWFRRLEQRGYRIRVYQNEYLDFCSIEGESISHCYVYPARDVAFLADQGFSARTKATLLLGYAVADTVMSATMPRLLGGPDGEPPRSVKELPELSTPPALDLFDRISEDLQGHSRGTAFFVHALLPHHAYVVDRQCRPWPEPDQWLNFGRASLLPDAYNTPATRKTRYRRYFEQVRCLYVKLDALFEQMRSAGLFDDAIIIVHGDHGSRISLTCFRDLGRDGVSDRDLVDSLSTLYAERIPGRPAGKSDRFTTIQRLFAEHPLDRAPTAPDRIYLHGGEHSGGSPYRVRRMPALPNDP